MVHTKSYRQRETGWGSGESFYSHLLAITVLSTMQGSSSVPSNDDMNRHCRVLSNFSKNPSLNNVDSIIKSLIALAQKRCQLQITVVDYIQCIICKKISGDMKKLKCPHTVHKGCLETEAKTMSNNTFDPERLLNLMCGACGRILHAEEYTQIIGRQVIEAYRNKANDKLIDEMKRQYEERVKKLSFECPSCLEDTLVSEGITLCAKDHRMCKECSKGVIMAQIDQGKYSNDEIRCQTNNCEEPLSQHLIRNCIDPEAFEKLVEMQHMNLKVEGLEFRRCGGYIYKDGKFLVQIPKDASKKQYNDLQDELERKCNAIQAGNVKAAELTGQIKACPAIIAFDPQENKKGGVVKCTNCQLDGCIKGCSSVHRGNTCEKYKEWEQVNKKGAELSFNELRAMGMAQCPNPKCMMPILRSAGCNWVKCRCGFQICYVCSQPWTLADPHVSRGGHGPFNVEAFLAANR